MKNDLDFVQKLKDIDNFLLTNPVDEFGERIQKADLQDGLIENPPSVSSSKFGKTEDLAKSETTYTRSGKKGEGWDPELNNPKANWTYKIGNYTYKTDGLGRVTEVDVSDLQNLPAGTSPSDFRNSYQQSVKCKTSKQGASGDQGGHLIGAQFAGPGEQINLVPMKGSINGSGGDWYNMEKQWANAKAGGKTVKVNIKIIYDGNDLRPKEFDVIWFENGVQKPVSSISNN